MSVEFAGAGADGLLACEISSETTAPSASKCVEFAAFALLRRAKRNLDPPGRRIIAAPE